jgi:sulfhydrogenase subunit beta (sulfur reductase)
LSSSHKTLRKDRLERFLERLLDEWVVLAPVKGRDGVVFEKVHASQEILLGYPNTKNSPKFALFPQQETLFGYRVEKGEVELDVPQAEEKGQVLFGVRPCDARGLLLLDRVFGGHSRDPYYAHKRAGTIVVGLGCVNPNPTCFCGSTGGGPCSPEGSDLFFLDLGDRYLVEAGSEKGGALLQASGFEDADEEALNLSEKIKKEAASSMPALAPKENLGQHLEELFDDPVWSETAETCLGCGICTYLCPACHCFDLCDEAAGSTGERIRVWDSCQFPFFTQQASGFNPRPTVKERFRQRIMHKFSYLPETQAMLGCVGCGRCVTECPVNLDIREVMTRLSEGHARQ